MRTMVILALLGISTSSFAAQPTPNPTPATQAQDDWKMIRFLMDKDNNDKISQDEANKLNLMPVRTLERDFALMDSDKNGVVTLREYTDHTQKLRAEWESEFKGADADRNGRLSKTELANTKPGQLVRIKRQFEAMDSNKDGQVTMEERDGFIPDKAAAQKARQKRAQGNPRAAKGTEQHDK